MGLLLVLLGLQEYKQGGFVRGNKEWFQLLVLSRFKIKFATYLDFNKYHPTKFFVQINYQITTVVHTKM